MHENEKDQLLSLINSIKPINKRRFYEIAECRLDILIKPKGSLGRLEEFVKDIIAITENDRPKIKEKYVCVFAGDHGVVKEGVSLFKQDVTAQMVRNFLSGGAAINAMSNSVGANVVVIDVGINADLDSLVGDNFINGKIGFGTNNIYEGRAMTYGDGIKSLLKGIEISSILKDKGADICATGDMGIANTTPSSAITCFYSKKSAKLVCGHGTGVSLKIIEKKIRIIQKAIKYNIQNGDDPIDVLSGIGGFEIGAIAGFILGCSIHRIPVVVDGFISCAGALIAININPDVLDYMFLGHLSKERGHKTTISLIKNKKPILDLSMRLGEGTGAVMAMKIIETAIDMYNNMATFDEANVFASKLNK